MSDPNEIVMPEPSRGDTLNSVYSEKVLDKAGDLLHAGDQIREDEVSPNVWWVQGSGVREYRVERVGVSQDGEEEEGFDGLPWMTCTCPNGSARGGRPSCYHTAAILLLLEEAQAEEE